jgi:hypothetical protein
MMPRTLVSVASGVPDTVEDTDALRPSKLVMFVPKPRSGNFFRPSE